MHAQPEPWLNRVSRTSSRIVSAMNPRIRSAWDAEAAEAVAAEHDVAESGKGVEGEVGDNEGPDPPPPEIDEAEDPAQEVFVKMIRTIESGGQ